MTPEHKHIAGLKLALNEMAEHSPMACALGEYHLRPLIQQAKAAPRPVQGDAVEPFAWAEFDGEGGHDLRLYENNEDYHQEYVKRNGDKFASWVFPLYDADLVELRALMAGTNYSASGDCRNARVVAAEIARIDAALAKLAEQDQ
jgi:hypothetical protein